MEIVSDANGDVKKTDMKTKKGFTLVEMIISMGVLVIMSTALAGTFSSGFSSYGSSRELQRNLETAQYALNTLEKLLRTSTVMTETDDGITNSVVFYEYSSGTCFKYTIHISNVLQARKFQTDDPFGLGVGPACTSANAVSLSTNSNLTSGHVTGNFDVTKSVISSKMGRVTVNLSVQESSASTLKSQIQATASLRDYSYVGY